MDLLKEVQWLIANKTVRELIDSKLMPDIAASQLMAFLDDFVGLDRKAGKVNHPEDLPNSMESIAASALAHPEIRSAATAILLHENKEKKAKRILGAEPEIETPVPKAVRQDFPGHCDTLDPHEAPQLEVEKTQKAVKVSSESIEAWEKLRHMPPNKANLMKALAAVIGLHGRETTDAVLAKFEANSLTERPGKKVLNESNYEAVYLMLLDVLAGTYSPL